MTENKTQKVTPYYAAVPMEIFMQYCTNPKLEGYLTNDLMFGISRTDWDKRLGNLLKMNYKFVNVVKCRVGSGTPKEWAIFEMPGVGETNVRTMIVNSPMF